MLVIAAAELPRMIRECDELTAVLVHVMVDRARVFKSSELLDEKMISLGRLAAGLAHELNNPASAVSAQREDAGRRARRARGATKKFCALNLSDEQCLTITGLRDDGAPVRPALSPLERADREDAIDAWLAAHDVTGVDASRSPDPASASRISIGWSRSSGADKMGHRARAHGVGPDRSPAAAEIETGRRAHPLAGRGREGLHVHGSASDAAADRDRRRVWRTP